MSGTNHYLWRSGFRRLSAEGRGGNYTEYEDMLMTINQRSLCCVLGLLVLVILAINFFKAEPLVWAEGDRITVEFYPSGESEKVNPVALSFSGKVYEDLVLPDSPEKSNLTDDEKFLAKAIAINKS